MILEPGAILILFLFACVVLAGYEPTTQLSFKSGNTYLTHADGVVFFDVVHTEESSTPIEGKYAALWDLKSAPHGHYLIKPADDPLQFLASTSDFQVVLRTFGDGTGLSWKLKQKPLIQGFIIESVEHSGTFIGVVNNGISLVNETDAASVLEMTNSLNWKPPQMLLLGNFEKVGNKEIEIPSLEAKGINTGVSFTENTFIFEQDSIIYQGLSYRLRSKKYEQQYLCINKNTISFTSVDVKSLGDEEYYDIIRCSTFKIYVHYIGLGNELSLMLESMAWPGRFITLPKQVGAPEVQDLSLSNLRKSLFNTCSIDPGILTYALTFNQATIKVSLSDVNNTRYLKHRFDSVWLEPLEIHTRIMTKFDSSWYIETGMEPGVFLLKSVNFPRFYISVDDDSNRVVLVKSRKLSQWIIKPMFNQSGVTLEYKYLPNRFLNLNETDGTAILSETPFAFIILNSLSLTPPVPIAPFPLGNQLNSTIRLRLFNSTEKLQFSSTVVTSEKLSPWRFVIRNSLNGRLGYCSFESTSQPGYFIRHDRFALFLQKQDDYIGTFQDDASWKVYYGFTNDNNTTISIESFNYPGMFITGTEMRISDLSDTNSGSNEWKDASFVLEEEPELDLNTPGALRRAARHIRISDEL